MAQTLEDMDEVIRYVQEPHLGFTIPIQSMVRNTSIIPTSSPCSTTAGDRSIR